MENEMDINTMKIEVLNRTSQRVNNLGPLVTVEHPQLTVGQLREQIDTPRGPIRRSAHVGNQPAHELMLMTAMPPGIEIMLVDTIQGNDSYHQNSPPKVIRLNEAEPIPLCTKKAASGKIVGSIVVDASCLPKNRQLVCAPEPGESLVDFHSRAIEMLKPSNQPMLMSEFFALHAELFEATMGVSHRLNEVSRVVNNNGQIETKPTLCLKTEGIFGIDDESPRNQGAMIPLNGMMALDMAISSQSLGSDTTIHLGGQHMIEYTRDPQRMARVGSILKQVIAEVGGHTAGHRYEVVDITGLAGLVGTATHISQHQLLNTGNQPVDLSQFENRPCGRL